MLGKLLKYETAAVGRILLPAYLALLLLSGVVLLTSQIHVSDVPGMIAIITFLVLLAVTFVLTFALMVQRFYKNLLGSEGYLMMTLPVSIDHLLWSKLLVSLLYLVLSFLVTGVSCVIMIAPQISANTVSQLGALIHMLFDPSRYGFTFHIPPVVYLLEALLLVVIQTLSGFLHFYLAISIGQLVDRHRGLLSVAAYIGIGTALQILTVPFASASGSLIHLTAVQEFFSALPLDLQIQLALSAGLLFQLVLGAVFYVATRMILRRHLNLA